MPSNIMNIMGNNGVAAMVDNIVTHNNAIQKQTRIHVHNIPRMDETVTINNCKTTVMEAIATAVNAIAIYKYEYTKSFGHYGIVTNEQTKSSNDVHKRIESILTTIYSNETTYNKEWGKPTTETFKKNRKGRSDAIAKYLGRQRTPKKEQQIETTDLEIGTQQNREEDKVTKIQEVIAMINKKMDDIIKALAQQHQNTSTKPESMSSNQDKRTRIENKTEQEETNNQSPTRNEPNTNREEHKQPEEMTGDKPTDNVHERTQTGGTKQNSDTTKKQKHNSSKRPRVKNTDQEDATKEDTTKRNKLSTNPETSEGNLCTKPPEEPTITGQSDKSLTWDEYIVGWDKNWIGYTEEQKALNKNLEELKRLIERQQKKNR